MAYNLYQVQLAQGWTERVNKENAVSEKFWAEQAASLSPDSTGVLSPSKKKGPSSVASGAGSTYSSTSTMKTGASAVLKDRLSLLEAELAKERDSRKQMESELEKLRNAVLGPGAAGSSSPSAAGSPDGAATSPSSRPGTSMSGRSAVAALSHAPRSNPGSPRTDARSPKSPSVLGHSRQGARAGTPGV
eukprot:jgi/Mesvir1/748/Mv17349-RA.1